MYSDWLLIPTNFPVAFSLSTGIDSPIIEATFGSSSVDQIASDPGYPSYSPTSDAS